jgi:hypothetical protein
MTAADGREHLPFCGVNARGGPHPTCACWCHANRDDPATIKAEHAGPHSCLGRWWGEGQSSECLLYRLAKRAEKAEAARGEAVALIDLALRSDDDLSWDARLRHIRAALTDPDATDA